MHGVQNTQPLPLLLNRLSATLATLSLAPGCQGLHPEARRQQMRQLAPLLRLFMAPEALAALLDGIIGPTVEVFTLSMYGQCGVLAVLRYLLLAPNGGPVRSELLSLVLVFARQYVEEQLRGGEAARGAVELDTFVETAVPCLVAVARAFPDEAPAVLALLQWVQAKAVGTLRSGGQDQSVTQAFVLLHALVRPLGQVELSRALAGPLLEAVVPGLVALLLDETLMYGLSAMRVRLGAPEAQPLAAWARLSWGRGTFGAAAARSDAEAERDASDGSSDSLGSSDDDESSEDDSGLAGAHVAADETDFAALLLECGAGGAGGAELSPRPAVLTAATLVAAVFQAASQMALGLLLVPGGASECLAGRSLDALWDALAEGRLALSTVPPVAVAALPVVPSPTIGRSRAGRKTLLSPTAAPLPAVGVADLAVEQWAALEAVHRLCWDMTWKGVLRRGVLGEDEAVKAPGPASPPQDDQVDAAEAQEAGDPLAAVLPELVRCGALTALLLPWETQVATVQRACDYLSQNDAWSGTPGCVQADVAVVCLELLGALQSYVPGTRLSVVDLLRNFLVDPPPAFEGAGQTALVDVLRQCAARMLSNTLKLSNDQVMLQTVVMSLLNSQYTAGQRLVASGRTRVVYENCLGAISELACGSGSEAITTMVISSLIRQSEVSPESLDAFLLDKLVDISLTLLREDGQREAGRCGRCGRNRADERPGRDGRAAARASLEEVLEFLAARQESAATEPHIRRHISASWQLLAVQPAAGSPLTLAVLSRLLKLFVGEATAQATGATARSSGELTARLAPVALLCQQQLLASPRRRGAGGALALAFEGGPSAWRESEQTMELFLGFRNLWLLVTALGVGPGPGGQRWAPLDDGWAEMLEVIARCTPALVVAPDRRDLDADLRSNSALTRPVVERFGGRCTAALQRLQPRDALGAAAASSAASLAAVHIYMLAVRVLESARVRGPAVPGGVRSARVPRRRAPSATRQGRRRQRSSRGTTRCAATLLQYLTDERMYGEAYFRSVVAMADRVLDDAVAVWRRQGDASAPTADCVAIVAHIGFRLPEVRAWCMRAAATLLAAFPHLRFSQEVVYLALDMLQLLTSEELSAGAAEILRERAAPHVGTWANVSDERQRAAQVQEFCRLLMDGCAQRSPVETMNLVQCYLLDLSIAKPTHFAQHTTFMRLMSHLTGKPDMVKYLFESYNEQNRFIGEVVGLVGAGPTRLEVHAVCLRLKREMRALMALPPASDVALRCVPLLYRGAALLFVQPRIDAELVQLLCRLPMHVFSAPVVEVAIDVWQWLITTHAELETAVLGHVVAGWLETMERRVGLYAKEKGKTHPLYNRLTYTPSRPVGPSSSGGAAAGARPHLFLLQFALERLRVMQRPETGPTLFLFMELAATALRAPELFNTAAASRGPLFTLLLFGMHVLEALVAQRHPVSAMLRFLVYRGALAWFEYGASWAETGRRDEIAAVMRFYEAVRDDTAAGAQAPESPASGTPGLGTSYLRIMTQDDFSHAQTLILHLLENELTRLLAWHDPLGDSLGAAGGRDAPDARLLAAAARSSRAVPWPQLLPTAFKIAPRLTVEIARRAPELDELLARSLRDYIYLDTLAVLECPPALSYLLHADNVRTDNYELRFLLYWSPTTPVTSVSLLTPRQTAHPWILQYALRVLGDYPAELVFFYVPQIVQALRYDQFGYIEQYILDTAHASPLFAHQIIWNMNANMFRDEQSLIADALKPVLDRIINRIIGKLSGADKEFYEREFGFFSQVTSISGKLKPYIRRTKADKKKKIDEELRQITVRPGVYLPTNPESIVVDIDYDSGRPLQSHAKAPFMATFKIKRIRRQHASSDLEAFDYEHFADAGPSGAPPAAVFPAAGPGSTEAPTAGRPRGNSQSSSQSAAAPAQPQQAQQTQQGPKGQWMSAIFKVGDDCRQDILALQLISMFKTIFAEVKLDMYLYPYRVIATAPGCGVIEVLPQSTSRDMIGREKINDLFDYYKGKFGTVHSVAFQKARECLVRSLAAYSVVLYLLQIKDRHNGNIMFDDAGHILHIDFGFILDISPGGINFESSPFKLTTEMIAVLGGDVHHYAYRRFSELVVKGFLAARPYMDEFVQMVQLMVDSGLPCFRGEATLRRLRERFLPGKSERQAAEFMAARIRESHENSRTVLYDEFQRRQNGIPY